MKKHTRPVQLPVRGPMPKLKNKDLPGAPPKNYLKSPLGIYLKQVAKTSFNAFARAIGVPVKTAQDWCYGNAVPSLPAAWEIERLTKGMVPMEAWLALPGAKVALTRWRQQQSAEVLALKAPRAGGFAAPEDHVDREVQEGADDGNEGE